MIKGIKIFDKKGELLTISLDHILKYIKNGEDFFWSITFIDGISTSNAKKNLYEWQSQINKCNNGYLVSWEELNRIPQDFFQMYEITIIGDPDLKNLREYDSEEEMINSCSIVIELIDCSHWEIYSSDMLLISTLANHFKQTEMLKGINL